MPDHLFHRYTFRPTATPPYVREKLKNTVPSGTSSATRADLGVLDAAVELQFS